MRIRRLEEGDDCSKFRSGNLELDRFFLRYAGQNQFRHHIGTTYIAIDDSSDILGFATVTASELSTKTLPTKSKRLPQYPIPVLRLARLAVDEKATGRGIGSALLRSVLVLAQTMATEIGCYGVVVDAKPEAVNFYERLGFLKLAVSAGELGDRPQPTVMFLQISFSVG